MLACEVEADATCRLFAMQPQGGGDDIMFGLVGDNPIKIVTSGETSLFWVQPIGE